VRLRQRHLSGACDRQRNRERIDLCHNPILLRCAARAASPMFLRQFRFWVRATISRSRRDLPISLNRLTARTSA
jgi:hypothetical protein